MMHPILLMSYEFPPAGGSGVQRVAKFAHYLPEFGWTPVILTSSPAKGRPYDASLLPEVEGFPAVRLHPRRVSSFVATPLGFAKRARALVRRPGGGGGDAPAGSPPAAASPVTSTPPLSSRLARYVSLDDASLWARAAVPVGVNLGRQYGACAVFVSGPPFSVLVAGAAVAQRLSLPLVVDMRDGWRDNPTAWYPSGAHRARSLAAERRVLAAARTVFAATSVIAQEARELGARDVRVLPNGYDAADVVPWCPAPGLPLRLAFMGKMYRDHAEPWSLLAALAALRQQRPELEITFEIIGDEWSAVRERVERDGLSDRVTFAGYLPHREAVRRLARADVALAFVADRPGARATALAKLFEYLGVGIPTLALVPPEGESAQLVRAAGGWVLAPDDVAGLTARLVELAEQKQRGALVFTGDRELAARYDRRALTAELAGALHEAVSL